MITSLTPEQESQWEAYKEKWLRIGLSTDRIDRPDAIKRWHKFNAEVLGNQKNAPVIFMDSPYGAWLAACNLCIGSQTDMQLIKRQVWEQIRMQVRKQLCEQVEKQVCEQVEKQIRGRISEWAEEQVEKQVKMEVGGQIDLQIWGQAWKQAREQGSSQIKEQVWKQPWELIESRIKEKVERQIREQVGEYIWEYMNEQAKKRMEQIEGFRKQNWKQLKEQTSQNKIYFVYPYCNFQFWAGYFSFYDFVNKVFKIRFANQEKWDMLIGLADLSWVYPLKNFTIISEKPTEIHIKNGVLHNERGMAIEYNDGFGVYVLNGVRVPKEVVMTRDVDLDPKLILTEKDAEVRREIVRKIGIDRVCLKLGAKILDKKGDYELINLDLGDGRMRPYLKMRNPSIHTWHVEGVPPEIKTVEEALNWRNQSTELPEILV